MIIIKLKYLNLYDCVKVFALDKNIQCITMYKKDLKKQLCKKSKNKCIMNTVL